MNRTRREPPALYVPLVQLANELGLSISITYKPAGRQVTMTSPKNRKGGAVQFRGLATENVVPIVTVRGIDQLPSESWNRFHDAATKVSAGGWGIYSDPGT